MCNLPIQQPNNCRYYEWTVCQLNKFLIIISNSLFSDKKTFDIIFECINNGPFFLGLIVVQCPNRQKSVRRNFGG